MACAHSLPCIQNVQHSPPVQGRMQGGMAAHTGRHERWSLLLFQTTKGSRCHSSRARQGCSHHRCHRTLCMQSIAFACMQICMLHADGDGRSNKTRQAGLSVYLTPPWLTQLMTAPRRCTMDHALRPRRALPATHAHDAPSHPTAKPQQQTSIRVCPRSLWLVRGHSVPLRM